MFDGVFFLPWVGSIMKMVESSRKESLLLEIVITAVLIAKNVEC